MRPLIITKRILQPIKPLLIVTVGACLTLLSSTVLTAMVPAAWADYTPPEGESPSGSTVAGGSRGGCDESSDLPFTVLAPAHHVGQTTTTTPTLAWFVPAVAPYRLRLSIYHTDPTGTLTLAYSQERIEEQGGLGHITLSPEEADLRLDQRYGWQVAIACDPNNPSYQEAIVSEFQTVSLSDGIATELATSLATADTPMERADVYASQGYWFDALHEALTDVDNDSSHAGTLATLLNELGQLEVATDENSRHGEYLLELSTWFNAR